MTVLEPHVQALGFSGFLVLDGAEGHALVVCQVVLGDQAHQSLHGQPKRANLGRPLEHLREELDQPRPEPIAARRLRVEGDLRVGNHAL